MVTVLQNSFLCKGSYYPYHWIIALCVPSFNRNEEIFFQSVEEKRCEQLSKKKTPKQIAFLPRLSNLKCSE